LVGHVKTTGDAPVTAKVALQVLLASHELVTVKVTVAVPPVHAFGAPVLLFVKTASQPPVLVLLPTND
jgi:hypothetical protein